MCLISFIVPLHNKEKYIGRCLASISSQQGDDIQIIVIDDGSTDNSRNIVHQFIERDRRIEYFYQENGGVSSARNKGLRHAKGKWVAFIDADDFIAEDYMEKVRPYLADDGIDCYAMGYYVYKNDKVLKTGKDTEDLEEEWCIDKIGFIRDFFYGRTAATGGSVCDKLWKLSVIKDHGLLFPGLKIGEDIRFNLEYIMSSNKWKAIPFNLYYYVQNQDSVTHGYNHGTIKNINLMMDTYRDFGRKYGIYDQIKGAIGCKNVQDIFSVIKIMDKIYPGICREHKMYKKLMKMDYYRKKIEFVDVKKLRKAYRVVYYFLKYRMAWAMVILVKTYRMVYRL